MKIYYGIFVNLFWFLGDLFMILIVENVGILVPNLS